jgi:chromosome segregation ATPase
MAISKQDIIEAAEKLQAAGINPTMQAIRDALGGGSFATISPALREWRNASGQRATVAIEMPSEAKAALERAGVDLWRIVTALATEKLTKVQEEAEAAIQAANADRDEALLEITRLENGIEQKGAELAEALAANEVATNALNTALDEIRELEINLADKARIDAENNRLHSELTELRNENKALVEEKYVLVGTIKDSENTLSRTEKELAQVSGQLKEKEVLVSKLQAENTSFDLRTQKLQIALDASESKAGELKSEVAELRKTIGDREREAGALAGELKAVAAESKELKSDLEKIRAQAGANKSKN